MKTIATQKKQTALKINLKALAVLAFVVMISYTSCRKADNSPLPTSTTDTKAPSTGDIGSQIALNIVESLNGKLGGVNLMDGIDSVKLADFSSPQNRLSTNSLNSLCGFFTDSLVNIDRTIADTTIHTGGNLTFYFNCKNGQKDGYTAYDSLNTIRTTPKGSYQYYVKQYYTIKALTDNHQFIGVNGDIYYYNQSVTHCSCGQTVTTIENVNYVLNDLTINVCGCSRDVLSGTATFKAYGKNWSVTGSMTFLGNHLADITINGKLYHANLQKHTITPA